jgi:hypothetical protein
MVRIAALRYLVERMEQLQEESVPSCPIVVVVPYLGIDQK